MAIQWARMAPDVIVVATEERAWLHQPALEGFGDPFAEPMSGPASLDSTRHLLDGALAAARRAIPPVQGPPLTPSRWAWRLASQYHTTHAGPILLAEAQARFEALGRTDLADNCARKVDEETGHDELALRDLRALGYQAETVVQAFRPPTAAAAVEFFTECIRSSQPVRALGYTYAVERAAMSVTREYVEAVENVLPAGVRATRCLRVHSAIGADSGHVMEAVELIASLSPEERTLVAQACYQTTLRMQTTLPGDEPAEEELDRTLAASR